MAKRVVDESSLTAVADAIRSRAGTTDALAFPDGFVGAVEGIPDLLEMSINQTLTEYTSSNILYGRSFWFREVGGLKYVNFPNLLITNYQGFYKCKDLETFIAPSLQRIETGGFYGCTKLKLLDLPSLEEIKTDGLRSSGITTLIMRKSKVCTLSAAANLGGTPIASGTGYIYVPSSLVDSYKSATNWSTYAAQFRALEDYTVDGTTTGELDESKI